MSRKFSLKFLLYLDISLLLIFIFYKSYLTFFEKDFNSNNIYNIKKIEQISTPKDFSFAVLGNIKSSLDVFDKKISKKLNTDKKLNFVISTGNSVINGAEDKYRILNKSLNRIQIPTIVGIGDKETSNNGAFKFYKHYGPFYFSYSIGDSYFLFLDTTGETSKEWQKEWVLKELRTSVAFKYKFVFMNKSPFKIQDASLLNNQNQYIEDADYGEYLTDIFSKYKVTSVFSSGAEVFNTKNYKNVQYFVTGGAGGSLLINNSNSYYHYIKVVVTDGQVKYDIIKQSTSSNLSVYRIFENGWFYLHSIFYLNFFKFILILFLYIFLAIIIKYKVSKNADYYVQYDDTFNAIFKKEKLNIAMFTNNYLPFIGGVPISILRLSKGLKKNGHKVIIFAPDYPEKVPNEASNIIRLKLLFFFKSKPFNFPIVNIFSSSIEKNFLSYNFDVVHVHHPFWMGKKGLQLGQKYGIPVILTYHTRLEKYAHNLPFFKKSFENLASHALIRRFSQKCDAIFAPTSSAKDYLVNLGVSRHKTILPTGIDFDFYNNIQGEYIDLLKKKYKPNNELILCSVSRLTEEKNIYFLLEGIKYIKEHCNIPFKSIIIGDGPEKENIMKTIEKEGLLDTIELLGSISPEQISIYYRLSDIFVFSSKSETQGMVILEAMAGECPVVAIRSSGIDDVILNEYNGYKTRSDIISWSQKVICLIENPLKLREMSQNAYAFSKEYSLEAMAETTIDVYYQSIQHYKFRHTSIRSQLKLGKSYKITNQKRGVEHE